MSKTASHTKQAQESQRKIDKILSAAEVEFGRKGYDGATIQAIADRAKLSKRQVIHFCRSKPEIYENVFRSIMTDWRGEEVDSEPGEPMELIENYVAVLFQTVRKNPVRSWFIINDMIRGGEGFTRNADETQINALMENRVERLKMWAAEGKIDDAVDPIFIFFMTWALQHFFAVFEPEIAYFLDKDKLDDATGIRSKPKQKRDTKDPVTFSLNVPRLIALSKDTTIHGLGLASANFVFTGNRAAYSFNEERHA